MSAPDRLAGLVTPLLTAARTRPIAWRGGEPIDQGAFLGDVQALAAALPDVPHGVNLCQGRYLFLVTFAALISRGKTNLLPPNRQPGTLKAFRETYPEACWFGDDAQCTDIDFVVTRSQSRSTDIPTIDNDMLAAQVFTSGSTGASKTINKPWGCIVASTAINAEGYFGDPPAALLATVPPQHMYGLESSVWMALGADVAVADECPLYPADVAAALARLPEPRALVSTPTHLAAMIRSDEVFPPCRIVVSATSPLSAELAAAVEERFGGECREVFGSSETGSVGARRTAQQTAYQRFRSFELRPESQQTVINAPHLPEPGVVADLMRIDGNAFTIEGRAHDLVNVGGKRGSLAAINARLLSIPGVLDGAVFLPDDADRLAALVVAPDLDAASIRAALREYFDPVFLPRPLYLVDALPRTASSKLPRAALLDRLRQLRGL